MTDRTVEPSPRPRARLAGAFYLITIVTGVFAELFVRGALIVRDDAAATAANILAHELRYRFGLAADLIMLASYIAVTFLLYDLLKPVSRSLSSIAAFFSMVGIAVLAVNSLNHLAPLVLLEGAHYASAFDKNQLQALALIALKMHGRGYIITGAFFGIYCFLIGYLVFRSGFLPRIVGLVMAIGGLSYLTNTFAVVLFPALAARLPDVTVIGGVAELLLCVWLLVAGVDVPKWKAKASE
jgi:hypothetical protein